MDFKKLEDVVKGTITSGNIHSTKKRAKTVQANIKKFSAKKNPQGHAIEEEIYLHDLHVKVENMKGSTRSGTDSNGKEWSIQMKFPYGYFARTKGADGDHVDCYVGDDRKSEDVYVVHQVDPSSGKFDEDKVMVGFTSSKEAKSAYLDHYDSPKFFGSMTEMKIAEFKESLKKNKGMKLSKAIGIIEGMGEFVSESELNEMIVVSETLIKGGAKSGLVQKKVWVTKNGKTYQTTVWVREGDETSKEGQSKNVPVGESIGAVDGMDIKRYSEKAVLISGDTYANKETMQEIKKEIGVGSYNGKLKGWVFPVKYLSVVLGSLFSKASNAGDTEKAEAIRNQKNEVPVGTSVTVGGDKGTITKGASDSEGIKYNIKTDGGEMKGVSENVISTEPATDDNKIKEVINNSNEANRPSTSKELYGIKPVVDIYKYSLNEYMSMHGLSDADINSAIERLKGSSEKSKNKTTSTSSSSSSKKTSNTKSGLSKQQLISKLIYTHYQSVQAAVKAGEIVSVETLSLYPELKEESDAMSAKAIEETKRSLSEAMMGNKNAEGSRGTSTVEGIPSNFSIGVFTYKITGKDKDGNVMLSVKGKDSRPFTEEKVKELYGKSTEKAAKDSKEAKLANKEKMEKAAKEFVDSMSKKDLQDLKQKFSAVKSEQLIKEQGKLASLLKDKSDLDIQMKAIGERKSKETEYSKRHKLDMEKFELRKKVIPIEVALAKQKNIVNAIANGGTLSNVTDLVGVVHKNVPDFTQVDTTDVIIDQETIFEDERPKYIPEIDADKFRQKSFIFDTIKVSDNKYMIATTEYREKSQVRTGDTGVVVNNDGDYDPDSAGYVVLTLDQLVLTQDYYTKREKQKMVNDAADRNARQLEAWNKKDDKSKERYMMQNYFYESMPAKAKKTITKEAFNALSWQEREKIHIPVKKYGMKRLKSKFDEKHMAGSFHSMYERFKDPKALRTDSKGDILKRGEQKYGKTYAHSDAWKSWADFRQTLDWKINDINIQREDVTGLRAKALETSYGESGTKNDLLDKHGIKVKRQNGSEIKFEHIDQIEKAWSAVESSFGSIKGMAKKDGLKVSHAGNTLMYASKAMGVFVPSMMTIGVTAKVGEDQLGFTLGHEVAHYLDYTVGQSKGSRFASNDYDSTAGQIAINFRENMNQKSDSNYINSTHECFARALEQYNAIKTKGDTAIRAEKDTYSTSSSYMNVDKFKTDIAPLIEKFLSENKEILKSIMNDLVIYEAKKL